MLCTPRDGSAMVAQAGDDIVVVDGGMVNVPGPVDLHFKPGFLQGKAHVCMAGTMPLTRDSRPEDDTVGEEISLERVKEISRLAHFHCFGLNGFRPFEREVIEAQIRNVRGKARRVGTGPADLSGQAREAKWAKPVC